MPKKAINSLFKKKKKKKERKSAINGVYIFSHFYRPTVFPLTRKNYWYSKLTSLLCPLFFFWAKERKNNTTNQSVLESQALNIPPNLADFCAAHFSPSFCQGNSTTTASPTSSTFPCASAHSSRKGCGHQELGRARMHLAMPGCRGRVQDHHTWRGLTLARTRRAGHRAEPAPRCCLASHAAFILVL